MWGRVSYRLMVQWHFCIAGNCHGHWRVGRSHTINNIIDNRIDTHRPDLFRFSYVIADSFHKLKVVSLRNGKGLAYHRQLEYNTTLKLFRSGETVFEMFTYLIGTNLTLRSLGSFTVMHDSHHDDYSLFWQSRGPDSRLARLCFDYNHLIWSPCKILCLLTLTDIATELQSSG